MYWINATESDFSKVNWISDVLGITAVSGVLSPLLDAGGMIGEMRRLQVNCIDSCTNYVLKFVAAKSIGRSKSLGLAREAFFYLQFAKRVAEIVPQVKLGYGNMDTGEKVILMADLSAYIQSGLYFGESNPNNWHKDLESITGVTDQETRRVLTKEIAIQAFEIAAKYHAMFWNDNSLLEFSWLRGSNWLKGEGAEEWLSHQNIAKVAWNTAIAKITSGDSTLKVHPHLKACMDSSLAKVSWEDYQRNRESEDFVFTLVHGDFHPGNMMWRRSDNSLIVLDWEAVGLGSGPQDCAQYVISHMEPAERRLIESELVLKYYTSLIGLGVTPERYPLARCWTDYIMGGVGRWVWLLAFLSNMCSAEVAQAFHDQLLAFILDHHISPENIPMPRV